MQIYTYKQKIFMIFIHVLRESHDQIVCTRHTTMTILTKNMKQ